MTHIKVLHFFLFYSSLPSLLPRPYYYTTPFNRPLTPPFHHPLDHPSTARWTTARLHHPSFNLHTTRLHRSFTPPLASTFTPPLYTARSHQPSHRPLDQPSQRPFIPTLTHRPFIPTFTPPVHSNLHNFYFLPTPFITHVYYFYFLFRFYYLILPPYDDFTI